MTPQPGVNLHVIAPSSSFSKVFRRSSPSKAPSAETPTTKPIRPHVASELIPKSGLTIINGVIEEHDWSGTVLVPKDLSTALVFTSKVAVQAIEVHPLQNGSVRIWTRLINRSGQEDRIQIGCSFRTHEHPQPTSTRFFEIVIPHDYIDVFFVSPRENIDSYTFLIRNSGDDPQ